MKNKKRYLLSSLIIALGLLLTPAVGRTLTIDFNLVPTVGIGTISYNGSGGPLVGTGIPVGTVKEIVSNTQYNLIGTFLNFTTGTLTGTNPVPPSWSFGGGPGTAITILGGVDVNGNNVIDPGEPSGTLLTGHFGTASVSAIGSMFKIAGSGFSDVKDRSLVVLFGGDPSEIPGWDGNFNISFFAAGLPPSGFTSTQTLSGDVVNEPVPEPATMLLLGSGLLGVGMYARRRFKK